MLPLAILMQLSWHHFSDFYLKISLDKYNQWPQLIATQCHCLLSSKFVIPYHSELSQGTHFGQQNFSKPDASRDLRKHLFECLHFLSSASATAMMISQERLLEGHERWVE